jgi:hypothetical protein
MGDGGRVLDTWVPPTRCSARMTIAFDPRLPATIDQVIGRLDDIIDTAIREGSRLGYFAALYNRVTRAIRHGIHAGAFDDNPRMERLDVVFANRYIEAYDCLRRGRATTASWRVAFDAAAQPDLSVFRHLVLGMNAHINLDLGIACAAVSPGEQVDSLRVDFNRINDVLALLLPTVEAQLAEISPRLGALSGLAHSMDRLDERLGGFSMEKARDGAWRFSRRLAFLANPVAQELAIGVRDAAVAAVARGLQEHNVAGAIISGSDREGISAHIRILARWEPG